MSSQETLKYNKIDLSAINRRKIKNVHGIETNEKIKIYDEIKHVKELWSFPNNFSTKLNSIRCHWDHNLFEGIGIFCPMSYKSKQVAKIIQADLKPQSGFSGDDDFPDNAAVDFNNTFVIKENISLFKNVSGLDKNIIEITDAYYEVDGVFCSPECCVAFINEEKSKAGGSKYADSERLLHLMLGLTTRVEAANSYRLLKEYGGNLTIEQFRQNNKSIKYKYYGTTVLISHLFDKQINLSTD